MSSVAVAELRKRRKAQGQKETTIWLSPEADQVVTELVKRKGLRSRSEAVQYALMQIRQNEEITAR